MGESGERGLKVFEAYAIVAFLSGLASVGIAAITVFHFERITDGGMWAIAAMVAAPALMGVGISYCVYRSSALLQARAVPGPAADASQHFYPRERGPG